MVTNIEIKTEASDSPSLENTNDLNVKLVTDPLKTDFSHKVCYYQFFSL